VFERQTVKSTAPILNRKLNCTPPAASPLVFAVVGLCRAERRQCSAELELTTTCALSADNLHGIWRAHAGTKTVAFQAELSPAEVRKRGPGRD